MTSFIDPLRFNQSKKNSEFSNAKQKKADHFRRHCSKSVNKKQIYFPLFNHISPGSQFPEIASAFTCFCFRCSFLGKLEKPVDAILVNAKTKVLSENSDKWSEITITITITMSRVIVCKLGRLGELRKLMDCTTNSQISVGKLLNIDKDKDKEDKKQKLANGESAATAVWDNSNKQWLKNLFCY